LKGEGGVINVSGMRRNRRNMDVFAPGDVVVREGEAEGRLYIIITGGVAIYKNYQKTDEVFLAERGTGEFFGEQSLFLGAAQPATVVAMEESLTVSLTRDDIFEFFRMESEATFALIADLCRRTEEKEPPPGAAAGPNRRLEAPGLFPAGHGHYRLPAPEGEAPAGIVFTAKEKCPVCGVTFEATGLRESRLTRSRTDPDMRDHYKGVEPMWYDVVTCPQCWYSALRDAFDTAEPADPHSLMAELGALQRELKLEFDNRKDAAEVFAGYYLALRAAPRCFVQAETQTARLWVRLSRLYEDCGDQTMAEYANRQALAAYEDVYLRVSLNPRALQRIQFFLGDLYFKTGDFRSARDMLFKAKIAREGTEFVRRYAEERIDLMREMDKQEKEPQGKAQQGKKP
jgi:tetratricopeptide (TPR) repeat protein